MAESNNRKRAGIGRVDLASQLWFTVLGSAHADWLGLLAQAALAVLLASSFTNACLMIAAVLAIRLIGGFLLEPVGRVIAARLDRRWAVVGSDAARAAMFVTVPLVGATWWLLLAALLGELATSVRVPLVRVAMPPLGPQSPSGRLAGVNQPSPITLPLAAGVFTLLALVSRGLGTGASYFDRHPTDLAFWFAAAQCLAAAAAWALAASPAGHAPQPGRTPPTALSRLPAGIAALTPSAFAATGGLVLGTGAIAGLAMIYAISLGAGPVTFGLAIFALCVGGALGILRRSTAAGAKPAAVGLAVAASGLTTLALAVIPVPAVVIPLTALAGWWAGRGWTALHDSLDDPRANAATHVVPRVGLALVPPLAALLAAPVGLTAVWLGDTGVSYNGDSVIIFAAGVITLGLGATAYVLAGGDVRRDLRGLRPRRAVRPTPTSASNAGYLIALEGGDGAGKSTQATALAEWLTDKGHEVVSTREPGGTELGERLRALLLDVGNSDVIGDRAEALLYAADRADHVERVILPALRRGEIVVTDRYVDSSIAYQGGGRDIPADEIADISAWATKGLLPNLTVVLDLPHHVAQSRSDEPADRLESEDAAFHTRVREAYLARAAAEPHRYLVIDATASPGEITEQIKRRLTGAIPLSDKERAEIAEAERKAREEAERLRIEEEKRKAEQQALVARLKAEAEARAAERARQEAAARAEAERIERERLEAERKAREEAERERAARAAEAARIEAERLAKERAEAERLAKERAEREAREAEERRKRLEEEARKAAELAKERAKEAALRQRVEQRAEAERAAARAAEAMAMAQSLDAEGDGESDAKPTAPEDPNALTVTVPAVTTELPNAALVETAELTLTDELLNMNPADDGKKKRRR